MKPLKALTARRQRGVTLTETLLVLGVAAILAAAAYRAYAVANNDARNNDMSNGSLALVGKIKQVWGTDGNYSGLDGNDAPDALFNSGILPAQFRREGKGSSAKIKDLHGYDVTFNGIEGAFAIGFTNLSKEACVLLASSLSGVAHSVYVGRARATTNSSSGTISISGGKEYKGPNIDTDSGLDNTALSDTAGCGVSSAANRKLVALIR